jgi:hypothetical protein
MARVLSAPRRVDSTSKPEVSPMKRIQEERSTTRRPVAPLDLRTPGGRALPF